MIIWEISKDVTGANTLLGSIHPKATGFIVGMNLILSASRRTRFSVSRGLLIHRDASAGLPTLSIFSTTGAQVHPPRIVSST